MVGKIWSLIEKSTRFFVFKVFQLEPEEQTFDGLLQFIKFGLVGVMNNGISYIVYIILVNLGMHYTPANIIGFTISVFNSYYWNNKYVFVTESRRVWWKIFLKTYISYAGTGIVLSNILLVLWIEVCSISEMVAPIINMIATMPINFLVNKFWAYKDEVSGESSMEK